MPYWWPFGNFASKMVHLAQDKTEQVWKKKKQEEKVDLTLARLEPATCGQSNCQSVRPVSESPSVRPSIRPSIRPFVCQSVSQSVSMPHRKHHFIWLG